MRHLPEQLPPLTASLKFSADLYCEVEFWQLEGKMGSCEEHQVEFLVPQPRRSFPGGSSGDKEQARNAMLLQDRQHIGKVVLQSIITGQQNRARRQRSLLLAPLPKLLHGNDAVLSLQKTDMRSQRFRGDQTTIQGRIEAAVTGG